jgi:hypothetical protein
VTRKVHLEASGRIAENAGNIPLNAPSENPCLIAEMIELTSIPSAFAEPNSEVCAFLHVLEGTLHLAADGMTQTLEQGDCAYMETRMPTALSSEGDHRCRVLVVKPAGRREGK